MTITGIAWDAGFGISTVEVSQDGGRTWTDAELNPDLGRYSVRAWQLSLRSPSQGQARDPRPGAKAVGQSQPMTALSNPAGYHHNAVARLALTVA